VNLHDARCILVAEDHAPTAALLVSYVESLGMRARVVRVRRPIEGRAQRRSKKVSDRRGARRPV
jgi:hypothetical protein